MYKIYLKLYFYAGKENKKMEELKIVYKYLKDLKPYENNPRNNDDAVDKVAESIKQFGFKVPLVIDKDNVIVAGHTRYKACLQLNISKVPCIIADDLTEQQVKAFRLADNKVGEIAGWDFAKLDLELDGLMDFDMSKFGFDETPELSEEDLKDLFVENNVEGNKADESKEYATCPHCGERFEI